MTAPVFVEKTCTKCGETKPLSEFHRSNTNKDGRRGDCAVCTTQRTKEWQARRRAELGEDAWLAQQRERAMTSRSTKKGRANARKHSLRWTAAVRELIENHRTEFDAIMRRLKYEDEA